MSNLSTPIHRQRRPDDEEGDEAVQVEGFAEDEDGGEEEAGGDDVEHQPQRGEADAPRRHGVEEQRCHGHRPGQQQEGGVPCIIAEVQPRAAPPLP